MANIVHRQAPRLLADAEHLARVCVWPDLPGLHVVDISGLASDLDGMSIGSGYRLAAHYGFRTGWPAVGVSVGRLMTDVLRTDHDRIETATILIEQTTLHEVAHAVLGRDDMNSDQIGTTMRTLRSRQRLDQPAAQQWQDHHDRWASALLILTDRAQQYRRRHGDLIAMLSHSQIEDAGHSVQALRRVIGAVEGDAPIGHLLGQSGPLTARLRAAGLHRPPGQPADQHGAVAAARST